MKRLIFMAVAALAAGPVIGQDPVQELEPARRNTETGIERDEIPGTLRRTEPESSVPVLGSQRAEEQLEERRLPADTPSVVYPAPVAVPGRDVYSPAEKERYPGRKQADTLDHFPVVPREGSR